MTRLSDTIEDCSKHFILLTTYAGIWGRTSTPVQGLSILVHVNYAPFRVCSFAAEVDRDLLVVILHNQAGDMARFVCGCCSEGSRQTCLSGYNEQSPDLKQRSARTIFPG